MLLMPSKTPASWYDLDIARRNMAVIQTYDMGEGTELDINSLGSTYPDMK
jgi:hypothetical protein